MGRLDRDGVPRSPRPARELGITWTVVGIDTSSFRAAVDSLRAWGEVRRAA